MLSRKQRTTYPYRYSLECDMSEVDPDDLMWGHIEGEFELLDELCDRRSEDESLGNTIKPLYYTMVLEFERMFYIVIECHVEYTYYYNENRGDCLIYGDILMFEDDFPTLPLSFEDRRNNKFPTVAAFEKEFEYWPKANEMKCIIEEGVKETEAKFNTSKLTRIIPTCKEE